MPRREGTIATRLRRIHLERIQAESELASTMEPVAAMLDKIGAGKQAARMRGLIESLMACDIAESKILDAAKAAESPHPQQV